MPVLPNPSTETLHLSLLQFAPVLRDVAANARTITDMLDDGATDFAITPELSLTGYDLRDAAVQLAHEQLPTFRFSQRVLLGGVASANAGLIYNCALLSAADHTIVVHRKIYLPTYGMFDEGRYFARGDRVSPVDIGGWRVGVLICEDFWHPALSYLLAMQGIH